MNKLIIVLILIVIASCKETVKKENNQVTETSRVVYLPYYNDESFTPHWLTPNTEEEKQFHKIPDFKLVDQLGDTLTQKYFENKIYILRFQYYPIQ